MIVPAHVERRHVALAATGCVALTVVAVVDPGRIAVAPPCPLRALTGLDCPLCGATRATHSLLNGDLAGALDFNALYVALLPLMVLAAVVWLRSGRLPGPLRRPAAPWVLLGVAIAFMVVRNVGGFALLAA